MNSLAKVAHPEKVYEFGRAGVLGKVNMKVEVTRRHRSAGTLLRHNLMGV